MHRLKAALNRKLAAATLLLMTSAHALGVTVSHMDNWRMIYMNGHYVNGGANEMIALYALHTPRQENLFVSFDVSSLMGQTALGDATVTFYADSTYGGNYQNGAYTLELYQLNQYNADVDLDAAGSFFKDVPGATGGTSQWRDNNNAALANLNYNNSVWDITTKQLASFLGPVDGDTASTSPNDGAPVQFTIAQADVQQWLDGTLPSMMVMAANNNPWINYLAFHDNATVTIDVASVPTPATIALFGLGFGLMVCLRRRPGFVT